MKKSIISEIYKPTRTNFPRRPVEIRSLDDLVSLDLADFQKLARFNHGYKYLLVLVWGASKFLQAVPIKNKEGKTVTLATEKLLKAAPMTPRNAWVDFGKEFYNKHFKKLMTDYKINQYSTYSEKKAVFAERVIQTIKRAIYKNFQIVGSYEWVKFLPEIVNKYNQTPHNSHGLKPASVSKKNEKLVLKRLHKKYFKRARKINLLTPGTYVRVSTKRNIFAKKFAENWSFEIFVVTKRLNTNPPTYLLNDLNKKPILGVFYRFELQVTKHPHEYLIEKIVEKKGSKCKIKYLGFPEPEWVSCP